MPSAYPFALLLPSPGTSGLGSGSGSYYPFAMWLETYDPTGGGGPTVPPPAGAAAPVGTGFGVDLLDSSFVKVGAGPLVSASRATLQRKLDQAGSFSIEASGADPSSAEVLAKRVTQIGGLLGTPAARLYTTFGSGTVDKIDRRVNMGTGEVGFTFSGSDLVGELANTSTLNTALESAGSPITVAAAVAAIAALVPTWTIDTTTYASTGTTTNASTSVTGVTNIANFSIGGRIAGAGIPANATVANIVGTTITLSAAATASATVALSGALVYMKLAGESVLTALNKIATTTGHHFRQSGTGRALVWLYKVQVSSGVRIISAGDGEALINNDEVALVKDSLEISSDTHDIVTRIYPSGGGNSTARIFLNSATLTAPAGYTISINADKEKSYIQHDAAVALYGVIERQVSFKDSNPNDASSTAAISTGNQVLTQAVEFLRLHIAPLVSYRFSLVKLDVAVYPGQTVQLVFRRTVDGYRAVDEDATLVVLDSTLEFRTDGDPRTSAMTVATTDRRPASDVGIMVGMASAQTTTDTHNFVVPRSLTADTAAGLDATALGVANTFSALQTLTGGLFANSELRLKTANVTGSATILPSNVIVRVTGGGAKTLTLPTAAQSGQIILIVDEAQTAAASNITVAAPVGQTLVGSSLIGTNGGFILLYSTGSTVWCGRSF